MSDSTNDKTAPPWHPITATQKWHEHVQSHRDIAHTSATERNRIHEEAMQALRDQQATQP